MHEGLLEFGQKSTFPVTNYLLWHSKLTNNAVKESLAKAGAVQVALQGIKVTYSENLPTIVKTESNPSEVGK